MQYHSIFVLIIFFVQSSFQEKIIQKSCHPLGNTMLVGTQLQTKVYSFKCLLAQPPHKSACIAIQPVRGTHAFIQSLQPFFQVLMSLFWKKSNSSFYNKILAFWKFRIKFLKSSLKAFFSTQNKILKLRKICRRKKLN